MAKQNKWEATIAMDYPSHTVRDIHTGDGKLIAKVFKSKNNEAMENEDNTDLIVSAVNACINLNPENPLAVAEAIEDMYENLKMMNGFMIALKNLDPKLFNDCRVAMLKTTIEQTLAKIKGGD